MSTLEEDLKLGDLTSDMPEHTDRLGMAMPFTLVLFALAAFAAAILWIVYSAMAGYNIDDKINIEDKLIENMWHGATAGSEPGAELKNLSDEQRDWLRNSYREQVAYEGAVVGFLIIISYAVVYGALKIAHRK